jgi:DHA1 family multidrug resistance protein-like MFS transporter
MTGTVEASDGEQRFPEWRRTLAAMVVVQAIMSLSFSFLTPVLPLFLPELGVVAEAQIYLWSGALAAITSFMAAIFSPLWGRIADRRGRKQMVIRSTLAIGLCTLLMGFTQDIWQMLGARTLMGIFAGFSSGSVILISTQMPVSKLNLALGLMSSAQLAGSLIGPVLGGGLADLSGSYRLPFFAAGVLALGSTLVCLVTVREVFTAPEPGAERPGFGESARRVLQRPELVALVAVLMLTQFATLAVQPVIALYVQDIVGAQANLATLCGVALSATGLAGMAAVPLLSRASDRFGEKRILMVALAGAALATAPQALVGSYQGFVVERFCLGLFVGSIVPVANALIAKTTPAAERGMVFGISSSAYFLGNSLGPATGGVVAAYAGLPWVFVVTTVLLATGLVAVALAVAERPATRA